MLNIVKETIGKIDWPDSLKNWNISLRPIRVDKDKVFRGASESLDYINNDNYIACVRNDIGKVVGMVKPTYNIVQNEKVMDMIDNVLCKHNVSLKKHVVKNNKNIYTNFQTNEPLAVKEGDNISYGINFNWGHGGANSLSILPYLGRLLCNNGMSTEGIFSPIKFKHFSINTVDRIKDVVKNVFEKLVAGTKDKIEFYRKLDEKQFSYNDSAIEFINIYKTLKGEPNSPRKEYIFQEARRNFHTAYRKEYNLNKGRDSMWTAYNACTHFITHFNGRTSLAANEKLLTNNKESNELLNLTDKHFIKLVA